jgi:hypothetical protein
MGTPIPIAVIGTFTLAIAAYGHGEIEIGPHGGRILSFHEDDLVLAEISVKGGKFQILILDENMKPVRVRDQQLTVVRGDRSKLDKLAVEKVSDKYFTAPTVKSGEWVIFQFKENAAAKPFTARLFYETEVSIDGKTPKWLHAH